MFAVVVLAWHPHHSLLVENGTERDHFPQEFFAGVEKGVRIVAGSLPVRAVLVDGLYHEVDSSTRSFDLAGRLAAKDALDRIPFFSGVEDSRTAREISRAWERNRDEHLKNLRSELTQRLDSFQLYSDVWWRSHRGVEHLIRLTQNAPRIATCVDLKLSLSMPVLLKFLEINNSWRETPERLPQELAGRKLSTLLSKKGYHLNGGTGHALLIDIREAGIPYLERCSSPDALLSAPGYIDKGTRSALHFLVGNYDRARAIAGEGMQESLGFPRQREHCEYVLGKLNEKGQDDHDR